MPPVTHPTCDSTRLRSRRAHRLGTAGLLCLLPLWGLHPGPALAREVLDMAGRSVQVPDQITRPFGAAPPLTALLYALAPELVIGLNMPFAPASAAYLPPGLTALPVLGSAMGHGRQINPEALLALHPDLALAWQNSFSDLDPAGIEESFRKIAVPVFYLKLDTLDDWPAAFELAGKLLGREARARELADYIRAARARVAAAVATIPAAERVRVYYAEGPDGLRTDCDSSFHTEVIALAGAENVYHCTPKTMVGQEPVGLEQVLLWAPQALLVQDPQFAAAVGRDPRWAAVPALTTGLVLPVPQHPLNWVDRPPSFMRALGIQWLAHALYPERFPLDLAAETQRFYRLFFGVELTAGQRKALVGNLTATVAP